MTDLGSWKSLIKRAAADAKFAAGASEAQILAAGRVVGVLLPDDLRSLLLESDGVLAIAGAEVIWSCAELVKRNHELRHYEPFRELYMPFDNLLFIGGDGGGDQFAFGILANGEIATSNIYRWDHETDGRACFSHSLRQYFEFLLGQSIG